MIFPTIQTQCIDALIEWITISPQAHSILVHLKMHSPKYTQHSLLLRLIILTTGNDFFSNIIITFITLPAPISLGYSHSNQLFSSPLQLWIPSSRQLLRSPKCISFSLTHDWVFTSLSWLQDLVWCILLELISVSGSELWARKRSRYAYHAI